MLTDAGKTLLSSTTTPASWQEFSSAEGNFAVLMPGSPAYEKRGAGTAVGAIDMHMFTLNIKRDAAYIVMYSDYPEIVTKAPPDRILDRGWDGDWGKLKGQDHRRAKHDARRIFRQGDHH